MQITSTQNDPQLNEMVEGTLSEIVSHLTERYNPISIIGDGSTGKGDIMALKRNDGSYMMISDFDLQMVIDEKVTRREMLNLSSELSNKYKMEVNVRRTFPQYHTKKKWFIDPKYDLDKPTISMYERKYSTRILYGRDITEAHPEMNPAHIPVWEGLRLILNRSGEILLHMQRSYIETRGTSGGKTEPDEGYYEFVHWKHKCILACLDAILIERKAYHWSIEEKELRFKALVSKETHKILGRDSGLTKTLFDGIRYKKTGAEGTFSDWEATVHCMTTTLNWLAGQELKCRFDNPLVFSDKWVKSKYVRKRYYRGPTPSIIYQNSIGLIKMLYLGKLRPSIRLLAIPHVFWSHLMYGTLPLLLLASVELKEDYLKKVRQNFSMLTKLRHTENGDLWEEWDYLRMAGNKLWSTFVLV